MSNSSKRTISRILAFVMLVSSMFTNFAFVSADPAEIIDSTELLSDSAVDDGSGDVATGQVYTFDATTLTAAADKEVLTQDEVDSFFTIGGKITKRTNSSGVSSVELAKNDGGTITFTTVGESSEISYDVSSTGTTNTSNYELVDVATGTDIADGSGSVTGSANGRTTVTLTVPAGTYTLTSHDAGNDRGLRVYSIAVADGTTLPSTGGDEPVVDPTEESTEATTAEVTTVEETTIEATTAESTEATTASEIESITPEAGKVYTVNFPSAGLEVNAPVDGWTDGMFTIASPAGYYHDGSHGLALFEGDTITFPVAGDATITLSLCVYGNGTTFTATDAAGNTIDTVAAKGASDGENVTIDYKGEATTITLTLAAAGEAYLHGLSASNAAEPLGEAKNFMLWLDDIASEADANGVKTVPAGTISADVTGDSVLTLIANASYADGATYDNGQYLAGNGVDYPNKGVHDAYKAGSRHATANDITTIPTGGEGTAIVFTPAETGTFVAYFASSSFLRVWDFENSGTRLGYVDSDVSPLSYAFKAEAGHTYVLSTTGKTNNMAYAGFEYIKDEPVTVSVSRNAVGVQDYTNTEVYLTDVNLGTVEATVLNNTTSVDLANGHTYELSTNDGGVRALVNGSSVVTVDGSPIVIDLSDIADETLTGEITGTPEGTVTELKFTNMVNGTEYTATITGTTYSCVMKPGEYNTSVVTTNGGVTYDRVSVKEGGTAAGTNVNEVYVEVPSADDATIIYLPDDVVASDSSILTYNGDIAKNNDTSIKASAGTSIVVPVNGAQKVTVSGWYSGTWDINGTNSVTTDSSANATSPTTNSYITDGTETSVTINITGEGTNYLYWIKIENVSTFVSEINVPGDFDTLTEAVAYIRTMADRPEGEEGRVTINLTADIEEQVVIDTPYVKINGNDHTISWYYGVGTFYYSIDGNGLYSERLARDKYSSNEGNGSLWGGVVIVRGDYFLAENTTFKNTYNYEVTEKEAPDVAYTTGGIPMRTLGTDVETKASKERSNALYVDADYLECYNCNILSSQDTLGANKDTDFVAYFKDCVIGGNTDFICGAGDMVFDNCTLQIKSMTNDASGDNMKLIGPTPREGQYVFRNCVMTVDTTANGPVAIQFGRTWQNNSKSAFINTETNGLIAAEGWGEMSDGQLETAQFIEYKNVIKGIPMEVTPMGNIADYTTMTKMTDEEVEAIVANFLDDTYTTGTILKGWVPVHYAQLTVEHTTEATTEAVEFPPIQDTGYEVNANDNFESIGSIVYKGDAIYEDNRVRVEAAQNLEIKADGDEATGTYPTFDDRVYAVNYTSTGENTSIDAGDGAGVKTFRLHTMITAKEDVTIVLDHKTGSGKYNVVLKNLVDSGTVTATDATVYNAEILDKVDNVAGAESIYVPSTIELKAGDVIYFGGQGTNPSLYGIDVIGGTTLVEIPDNGFEVNANNSFENIGSIIFKDEAIPSTVENDNRVIITAAQNLEIKADGDEATGTYPTFGDAVYGANYTSTGTNTIVDLGDGNGGKTYRLHTKIEALEDVTITINAKTGSGKANYILGSLADSGTENAAGETVYNAVSLATVDNTAGSDSIYEPITIELKAGDVVYFAGQGTNPSLYGIDVEGTLLGPSTDVPEPSTEPTTEAPTEEPSTEVSTEEPSTGDEPVTEPTTGEDPDAKLWGDVNSDKVVAANDAAMVIQYVLNARVLEGFDESVADVSGNGIINSEDAAMILQKSLDASYRFPVEGDEPVTEATTEGDEPTTEATTEAPTTEPVDYPVVYVVGDSTACTYGPSSDAGLYTKRVGYGDAFVNYLDENVQVVNLALSGRSSKSFTADPEYQTLLDSVAEGDYVLIGFGHNDEKVNEEARGTYPGGTKEDEGTFKNSVYTNYIVPVQEKGATPILVTPIVRRTTTTGVWSDSQLHIANGGNYSQDMIDLAAELGLVCIDATTLTKNLYDQIGADESAKLHSWSSSDASSVDNTHLNSYGAKYVAYLISEAIKTSESGLAQFVKDGNVAPTEADIVVNPDYTESVGEPTDLSSYLWTTTDPWHASVFGDMGGDDKIFAVAGQEPALNEDGSIKTNPITGAPIMVDVYDYTKLSENAKYAITENADGSVAMRAGEYDLATSTATTSVGKIAGSTDGLALYYQAMPAGNVEVSATVTINSYDKKNNQVAFGAIVMDNIKVDEYVKETYNYVACGPFRYADHGATNTTTGAVMSGKSAFMRGTDNKLDYSSSQDLVALPEFGSTIDVNIKKVGDVFTTTMTIGDQTYTNTYTLPMTDNMYVGFFTARCADVVFSNININNEVVE